MICVLIMKISLILRQLDGENAVYLQNHVEIGLLYMVKSSHNKGVDRKQVKTNGTCKEKRRFGESRGRAAF